MDAAGSSKRDGAAGWVGFAMGVVCVAIGVFLLWWGVAGVQVLRPQAVSGVLGQETLALGQQALQLILDKPIVCHQDPASDVVRCGCEGLR